MLLGDVFDRFAAESPVSVMARAAFEHALPADAVDELFAEHAERQYTRELLFSQLVDLMGLVVCRVQPSLNAAIRKRADALGVTRKAVYAEVARMEPGLGAALVRHTAARLGPVVAALEPTAAPSIPGFLVRVVDGSHLPGTEHRLRPLRRTPRRGTPGAGRGPVRAGDRAGDRRDPVRGRPRPGAVAHPDHPRVGRARHRLGRGPELLHHPAARGDRGPGRVLRHPPARAHPDRARDGGPGGRGRTDAGAVFEEAVRVSDGADGEVAIRRVTVVLDAPTRDETTRSAS